MAAKVAGEKTYFTGRSCPNDHLSHRFTSNGRCVDCSRDSKQQPEAKRKANKLVLQNKSKRLAAQRKYRDKNRNDLREKGRAYVKANQQKVTRNAARYRAAKLQATPLWADQEAINVFYECRPEGFHVDHVIPLRGEAVCGLHVETNLQWLPAPANQSKGNRWAE